MFILENDNDERINNIRTIIGTSNLNSIKTYIKKYNELIENNASMTKIINQMLSTDREYYLNSLFIPEGFCGVIQLNKLQVLSRQKEEEYNNLYETSKNTKVLEGMCSGLLQELKNQKTQEKLDNLKNIHLYNTKDKVTSEDVLYDLIINNEIELLNDYIRDYRSYLFDSRLAKIKNKPVNEHNINSLNTRFDNIIAQGKLLNKLKDREIDLDETDLIVDVIKNSYSILRKSLTDGITNDDMYGWLINTNRVRLVNEELNNEFNKYFELTDWQIENNGKIIKNNKNEKIKTKIK